MEKEKPIIRIELAPGARLEKTVGPFGTTFGFPIIYVCEDGTRYDGYDRSRLKRDAVARMAKHPITPHKGEYAACLDADGKLVSTLWAPFAYLRNAG